MRTHIAPLLSDHKLPHWWEPLYRASGQSSAFLSPEWIGTWLNVYGHDFSGHWICWESGNTIVGGTLLVRNVVIRRFLPFHSVCFNATGATTARSPLAEFNDVLHLPGFESAIAHDLKDVLLSLRWNQLLLSGHEDKGVLQHLAESFPAALVERELRPSPYVDLSALQDVAYEKSLSSNTRARIRRSIRLYEETSGPVTLTSAASAGQALEFLDELAHLHNLRWQSRGIKGGFESPEYMNFHRLVVPRLWKTQSVDILRIASGNAVIGYLYNLKTPGKISFFQSGFAYATDPKFKPGLVTHALAIEHYQRHGLAEYDFLAGDARYKRSLAKSQRNLYWTVVYRDSPWLRLLLWIRRMKNTGSPALVITSSGRSGLA